MSKPRVTQRQVNQLGTATTVLGVTDTVVGFSAPLIDKGSKLTSAGAKITKGNVIVAVASTVISGITSHFRHKKDMKEMVLTYRTEIAKTLNIPEDKVDEASLRKAAKQNKTLAKAVGAFDTQKKMAVPKAIIVGGVGLAATAVASVFLTPFVGAIVGGVVAIASDWGMTKLEKKIGGDHEKTADAAVRQVVAKQSSGVQTTMADTFAVHVARDKKLQAAIVAKHGKAFEKLEPKEKLAAMLDHQAVAKKAAAEAMLVNAKEVRAQQLSFASSEVQAGVFSTKPRKTDLEAARDVLLQSGVVTLDTAKGVAVSARDATTVANPKSAPRQL